METPPSMRADLARWNNGAGVDLAGYVSGMGSFSLAVGCCTVFWPRLVLFEDYILREGVVADKVLRWPFPDRPCKVVFDKPADEDDLMGYQVSFWQKSNETLPTPRHR